MKNLNLKRNEENYKTYSAFQEYLKKKNEFSRYKCEKNEFEEYQNNVVTFRSYVRKSSDFKKYLHFKEFLEKEEHFNSYLILKREFEDFCAKNPITLALSYHLDFPDEIIEILNAFSECEAEFCNSDSCLLGWKKDVNDDGNFVCNLSSEMYVCHCNSESSDDEYDDEYLDYYDNDGGYISDAYAEYLACHE